MARRFGFGKKERLKSRKQIEDLFEKGRSLAVFPLRVTYRFIPSPDDPCLKAGVTASKRLFKRAVDRNRIKRLLREAYRLQKAELADALKIRKVSADVFFTYTDKTIASFDAIRKAMQICLNKLHLKLQKEHEDIP